MYFNIVVACCRNATTGTLDGLRRPVGPRRKHAVILLNNGSGSRLWVSSPANPLLRHRFVRRTTHKKVPVSIEQDDMKPSA
jgi:hypothetical protein